MISKEGVENFFLPKSEEMHPVDLAHFSSHLMDNNVLDIETEIEISVATMGQDQRHRTVRRSKPSFNGKFYFPPVLDGLGLEREAEDVFNSWLSLRNKLPESLMLVLAPYGAMVNYRKKGSYNAVVHECQKDYAGVLKKKYMKWLALYRSNFKTILLQGQWHQTVF